MLETELINRLKQKDEEAFRIIFNDNLTVLKKIESGSINLIYIDPPFNTGKKQTRTQIRTAQSVNGDRKGFKGNSYETIELGTKEYDDDFGDSFIEEFILIRLAPTVCRLLPVW